jgi:hypothetical protein
MAKLALRWLPRGKAGPMIKGVTPFRRAAAGLVSACLVASLGVGPARAQGSDDGWFDDGTGQAPEPAPRAPASPSAPNRPGEPTSLAPSPLLPNDAPASSAEDQDPRALSAWSSYVDPYGSWVDDPRYGRVWMPSSTVVGSEFAPYSTGGHWALDENDDWVWVSDYPFGWVTFHYGRWVWIGGRGWAWVPGMRYAPAWVTWRVPYGSYAYVGWAPMPPAYLWFGGGAIAFGYDPLYPWVFCPSEYVFSTRVHYYIVHDRYTMGYAARYTRPYYTAPRAGGRYVAAPHGPSLQAAHVPSRAVPSERVSSRAMATRGSVATGMTAAQRRDFATRGGTSRTFEQRSLQGRSERAEPMRREAAPTRGESLRPDVRGRPLPQRSAPAPAWNGAREAPRSAPTWNGAREAPRSAPAWNGPREAPRSAPERTRVEPQHFNGGGRAPAHFSPSPGGGRTTGGGSHGHGRR